MVDIMEAGGAMVDILGSLYLHGLACLVERILAGTDARTVAACHGVSR